MWILIVSTYEDVRKKKKPFLTQRHLRHSQATRAFYRANNNRCKRVFATIIIFLFNVQLYYINIIILYTSHFALFYSSTAPPPAYKRKHNARMICVHYESTAHTHTHTHTSSYTRYRNIHMYRYYRYLHVVVRARTHTTNSL